VPAAYYVFNVLQLDGDDLTMRPYVQRRELLGQPQLGGIGDGAADVRRREGQRHPGHGRGARHRGRGGRAHRRSHEPARRSRSWVKTPLRKTAEVVIGGWIAGEGRRNGMLGALPLTVRGSGGDLRYVGAIGTVRASTTGYALRQLCVGRPGSPPSS